MQLIWKPGPLNSALHAASAIARGKTLVDPALHEALAEPAMSLHQEIVASGLGAGPFRRALAGFATQFDSPKQIVERAVVKVQGNFDRGDLLVARINAVLVAVVRAFDKACPNAAESLRLRERPLRDQWESRGPGLLKKLAALTDERLIPEAATAVLVHPALGGGGEAYLAQNAVSIEAVLTNPHPQLPETVRLAWLFAQLQCDLPIFADYVNAQRMPHVAAFALLPVTLQAAQYVELCEATPALLQQAIELWHLPRVGGIDPAALVSEWWETYEHDRPPWPVALTALDRMFG